MDGNDRLGRFEEIVLLALVRLRENTYGVTIRREIAERTGRDVLVRRGLHHPRAAGAKGLRFVADGGTDGGAGR